MKKSSLVYIISIIITLGVIITFVVIALKFKLALELICLGGISFIPICLVQVGLLLRSMETEPVKEVVLQEVAPTSPASTTTAAETSVEEVKSVVLAEESIHEKWAKAMYERFGEKWTEMFTKATYPADKSTRGEISVEMWKIASLTMDYLFVVNNDPNVLKRNKEMTNAVIEGLNLINDVELKEFYNDPTSVQQKVLIVNDLLSSQLAAKQTYEVPIFGHKVELNVKK